MTTIDIHLSRKDFKLEFKETFSPGITGIYGPSGSGKTSLLLAISGLLPLEEGRVVVAGRTLFDAAKKRNIPVENRKVAAVFQEGRLFPHMTVFKNLRYGWKPQSNMDFEEVVDLLQLRHLLYRMPSQISGGERQRTALGRSLLSSPDILLLDEPFSAVDVSFRSQLLSLITSVQKKVKIPILVVSHNLKDLLTLSNRLLVLKEGKCVGHGNYYDLLAKGSVSKLLGSKNTTNTLHMQVAEIMPDEGIVQLRMGLQSDPIFVTCKCPAEGCSLGQQLQLFVHANDIALSSEKIENASIQNQLSGIVTAFIERESVLLCRVDVGVPLYVEITVASKNKMHLSIGSRVFCLFKAVAVASGS
jgi:molybdate transport system ATP-binding protein